MLTILCAIGSILIFSAIISFLPMGFTKKGKILVVLTSLSISVVGLIAVTSIPFWETTIILMVLILIAMYFINNRIGNLLYKEIQFLNDGLLEENVKSDLEYPNNTNVSLAEVNVKTKLPEATFINAEKGSRSDFNQSPEIPALASAADIDSYIIDEDISFLLDRDLETRKDRYLDKTERDVALLENNENLLVFKTKNEGQLLFEEIDDNAQIDVEKALVKDYGGKEVDTD